MSFYPSPQASECLSPISNCPVMGGKYSRHLAQSWNLGNTMVYVSGPLSKPYCGSSGNQARQASLWSLENGRIQFSMCQQLSDLFYDQHFNTKQAPTYIYLRIILSNNVIFIKIINNQVNNNTNEGLRRPKFGVITFGPQIPESPSQCGHKIFHVQRLLTDQTIAVHCQPVYNQGAAGKHCVGTLLENADPRHVAA